MSFSGAVSQLFEFSKLTAHMASVLDVEESAIMDAINSFEFSTEKPKATKTKVAAKEPEKPAKTTKAKSTTKTTKEEPASKPAKTTAKKTKSESHTCSFVLTKVRAGEECGKSASNEHEGDWYCSSHIKMVVGSPKKAVATKKTTAKKAGQSPVDNKPVLKTLETRELKLRKNPWGLLWDSETHITFKKNDDNSYTVTGQQDMNAQKGSKNLVIPLTGEQLGICQGWNLEVDEAAMPAEQDEDTTSTEVAEDAEDELEVEESGEEEVDDE